MDVQYEALLPQHYTAVIELWQRTEGLGLGVGDEQDELTFFLNRNEGLSFIAKTDDKIIGTILCGHDGRRAYIYHLAVDTTYRFNGIGKTLVNLSLKRLKEIGIGKCHLFVFNTNTMAQAFWSSIGWNERTDLVIMSHNV